MFYFRMNSTGLDACGMGISRRYCGFVKKGVWRAVRDACGIFWLLTDFTDYTDLTQMGEVFDRSNASLVLTSASLSYQGSGLGSFLGFGEEFGILASIRMLAAWESPADFADFRRERFGMPAA